MAILSANWRFDSKRKRAHTRTIIIPFFDHTDEPQANVRFRDMDIARQNVSASVGEFVKICNSFETSTEVLSGEIATQVARIFTHSHERFTTTMTTFMYFFLEVSVRDVCGL